MTHIEHQRIGDGHIFGRLHGLKATSLDSAPRITEHAAEVRAMRILPVLHRALESLKDGGDASL